MHLNTLSYYADFFISAALVALIAVFVVTQANLIEGAAWAAASLAGAVGWTLIEYSMHRWLYHHAPYFSRLHQVHHAKPQDHIGAPPVIGVVLILLVGFVPFAGASLWVACGLTTGLLAGFMAYMLVHHASHYWASAAPSWLYQARLHHSLHHYKSTAGNFGITTAFWDHAFGTALAPSRGAARPQLR